MCESKFNNGLFQSTLPYRERHIIGLSTAFGAAK